ncbi:MAG: hypothetical protein V1792_25115, partial [Pseudomonadota bacterium]
MGEDNHDVGGPHSRRASEGDSDSKRRSRALRFLAVTVGLVVILAIVGLPLIERLLTLYWKTPQDADIPHDIKAMVSDDLL